MAVRIPKFKPWQWALLVVGAIATLVGCGLLARAVDPRELIARIGALGALPFFAGLAVLPALGAPVLPFYLLAGATFGLAVAIPAAVVAISVNLALSYAAARWWLRPQVVRLVERFGHRVPEVRPEDHWNVTLLVRITPGPPFFIQSYLLGLAGIPFGIYMAVSAPVSIFLGVAMIVFGESLLSGNAMKIFFAVSLVIVAVVAIRLVRGIAGRRRAGGTAAR